MMRKCLRCGAEMKEGLVLMTADAHAVDVREKGLFKGSLGKVAAAVCPECGYLEPYLENTEKLRG